MRPALLLALAPLLFASRALAQEPAGPAHLAVPGSEDAYYVEPAYEGEYPVILVLHPRNGDPEEDCRKWAEVASQYGWVLCPSGPLGEDRHARSWGRFDDAKPGIDAAMDALHAKFGARVRASGNAIIGFSEGALIGQILGIREPARYTRWLILAGSDRYWGDRILPVLRAQRRHLSRVVMLTGEHDPIVENTLRAGGLLRAAGVPVRVIVRRRLGHEVPADRMAANYEASLRWLFEGR